MRIYNIKRFYKRRKDLRNNSTPEEDVLWFYLKHSKTGFKFRRQHSIGGYIVDFYCPLKRLVVEIDGPQHFGKENIEYDKIRTEFFDGLDIQVIRFNNIDINKDINIVLGKISLELTTP